jgi:hypothetical protein
MLAELSSTRPCLFIPPRILRHLRSGRFEGFRFLNEFELDLIDSREFKIGEMSPDPTSASNLLTAEKTNTGNPNSKKLG